MTSLQTLGNGVNPLRVELPDSGDQMLTVTFVPVYGYSGTLCVTVGFMGISRVSFVNISSMPCTNYALIQPRVLRIMPQLYTVQVAVHTTGPVPVQWVPSFGLSLTQPASSDHGMNLIQDRRMQRIDTLALESMQPPFRAFSHLIRSRLARQFDSMHTSCSTKDLDGDAPQCRLID